MLPRCSNCSGEVKPGEDYCWGCLGEDPKNLPYEEFADYEFAVDPGTVNWVPDSKTLNSFTISGTTITLAAPLTLNNGDSISFTTGPGTFTYSITGLDGVTLTGGVKNVSGI